MNEVWVVAEQRLGRLMNISLELLGKGAELASKLDTKLCAVILGSNIENLAGELIYYGADKVYLGDDVSLKFYQSDLYTHYITDLVNHPVPRAQGVLVTLKVYGNSSLRQRPQGVLAITYKIVTTSASLDCSVLDVNKLY